MKQIQSSNISSNAVAHRESTSLRGRLSKLVNTILWITVAVFVLMQVYSLISDYIQKIDMLSQNAREGIIRKGKILVRNNSVALRGMATDNAISNIRELVTLTVKEDKDLTFGIFMDANRVPWVVVEAGKNVDMNARFEQLNDSLSRWADTVSDVSIKEIDSPDETILEFAAPVITEYGRLGVIRYGISLASISAMIKDMKRRALLTSMIQPVVFIIIYFFVYLFAFRLSRRQADEIIRPLNELKNAASTIASGKYSIALEVTSDDEIGSLAHNFEKMRKTIYTYTTKLESIVAKRTEQLEGKNKELQEFARIASHDLQEPLRKISSFGERVKAKLKDSSDEQVVDYLGRMIGATRRMQSLIEGLLAYSRVTTKASPFIPVKIGEVIKDVLEDLEVRISEVHGRVEIGEMAPSLQADEMQMRQLMQNLIGNGLKYHRKDADPVIKVHSINTTMHLDGSRVPAVEIIVEDNGIGIAEEHFEKIFVVFQRLHGRSSEFEGSGIGLSVVKKIIDRHSGTIRVESKVNEWTRFIVNLPLVQNEVDVQPVKTAEHNPVAVAEATI